MASCCHNTLPANAHWLIYEFTIFQSFKAPLLVLLHVLPEGGVQINFPINQKMPLELAGFEPGAAATSNAANPPAPRLFFYKLHVCYKYTQTSYLKKSNFIVFQRKF